MARPRMSQTRKKVTKTRRYVRQMRDMKAQDCECWSLLCNGKSQKSGVTIRSEMSLAALEKRT